MIEHATITKPDQVELVINQLRACGLTDQEVWDYRMARSDIRRWVEAVLAGPVAGFAGMERSIAGQMEDARRTIYLLEEQYEGLRQAYDSIREEASDDEIKAQEESLLDFSRLVTIPRRSAVSLRPELIDNGFRLRNFILEDDEHERVVEIIPPRGISDSLLATIMSASPRNSLIISEI